MSRVLVVDDDRNVRFLAERILKQSGHEVEQARDGAEALALIRAKRPDLVLLDLTLPGLDGADVMEQIHQGPTPPPVVILSGHGAGSSALAKVRERAAAFVTKPFALRELVTICEEAIRKASA